MRGVIFSIMIGGFLKRGRKTKGQKPWTFKIQPFLFKEKKSLLT